MYYDDDFYLTPEEELDFDKTCEAADPRDSYRFTDTLVLHESNTEETA